MKYDERTGKEIPENDTDKKFLEEKFSNININNDTWIFTITFFLIITILYFLYLIR